MSRAAEIVVALSNGERVALDLKLGGRRITPSVARAVEKALAEFDGKLTVTTAGAVAAGVIAALRHPDRGVNA